MKINGESLYESEFSKETKVIDQHLICLEVEKFSQLSSRGAKPKSRNLIKVGAAIDQADIIFLIQYQRKFRVCNLKEVLLE